MRHDIPNRVNLTTVVQDNIRRERLTRIYGLTMGAMATFVLMGFAWWLGSL